MGPWRPKSQHQPQGVLLRAAWGLANSVGIKLGGYMRIMVKSMEATIQGLGVRDITPITEFMESEI